MGKSNVVSLDRARVARAGAGDAYVEAVERVRKSHEAGHAEHVVRANAAVQCLVLIEAVGPEHARRYGREMIETVRARLGI